MACLTFNNRADNANSIGPTASEVDDVQMDSQPLYLLYLLFVYIFPVAGLLATRKAARQRAPYRLILSLIAIPVFVGAVVYAASVFPQVKVHSARAFITIALTVFLFTIIPDGIWSGLFGQLEWAILSKYASKAESFSWTLFFMSVVAGAFGGAAFYSILAYTLHEIHAFYGLTEAKVVSPVFSTAIAYASGGAVAGVLAASDWVKRTDRGELN